MGSNPTEVKFSLTRGDSQISFKGVIPKGDLVYRQYCLLPAPKHTLKIINITLLSDAYFPVRFRAQQRTKYNPLQLIANCITAIWCLRHYIKVIEEGHKFPRSLTLLSFKTQIGWPLVLIATANFPSLLFQLLQYPRHRPSYSAHRAAVMTKTISIFPAFSARFRSLMLLSL